MVAAAAVVLSVLVVVVESSFLQDNATSPAIVDDYGFTGMGWCNYAGYPTYLITPIAGKILVFRTHDDNSQEDFLNHPCYEGYGIEPSCSASYDHVLEKYVVATDVLDTNDPVTGNFTSGEYESFLFNQKAQYTQQTFQVELPLTDNYQLNLKTLEDL